MKPEMHTIATNTTQYWYQIAEGLRDTLEFLNAARTPDEILTFIVDQACRLCDASAGVIYNFDVQQRLIHIVATVGLPQTLIDSGAFALDGPAVWPKAILEGQPFIAPDLEKYIGSESLESGTDYNLSVNGCFRANLIVPIFIKAEVYGAVGLYYDEPRDFSAAETELAVMLGNQAALAIENAQLRVASEQVGVDRERSRLARDLHDSVTQSLYSLTLLAEAARRLSESGDVLRVAEAIARLGEIGQQALKEMRLLVYELRPLVLEQVGLLKALQQRLNAVERRAGLVAHLLVEGDLTLSTFMEKELYFVIQEALNNVLKHAEATSVTVRICESTSRVEIEIVDNGKGFPDNVVELDRGIGLHSMQERVNKLGGILAIESAEEQGSRVHIVIDMRERHGEVDE